MSVLTICALIFAWTSAERAILSSSDSRRDMDKVFIEGFLPIIPRKDGTLNLAGLPFNPKSVLIEGVGGLVNSDGITEHTWKDLVESSFFLPPDGMDSLGTESNPLHITGEPLSGSRPSDSETVRLFRAKLQEEGVRIDSAVMKRCITRLWTSVLYATSKVAEPGDARMVWQDALVFLGSRTHAAFEDQAHLSVGKPWISGRVTLLTAVDLLSGELLVIKLLPCHEERYRLSAEGKKGAMEDLHLNTFSLEGPLVRTELIKGGAGG
ncbi:g2261 [Coccomyxa elongata]